MSKSTMNDTITDVSVKTQVQPKTQLHCDVCDEYKKQGFVIHWQTSKREYNVFVCSKDANSVAISKSLTPKKENKK